MTADLIGAGRFPPDLRSPVERIHDFVASYMADPEVAPFVESFLAGFVELSVRRYAEANPGASAEDAVAYFAASAERKIVEGLTRD